VTPDCATLPDEKTTNSGFSMLALSFIDRSPSAVLEAQSLDRSCVCSLVEARFSAGFRRSPNDCCARGLRGVLQCRADQVARVASRGMHVTPVGGILDEPAATLLSREQYTIYA
jgi:hypothetical protein